MSRTAIERRLRELGDRSRTLRDELAVVDEQLGQLADEAEDARLRAFVSETPMAQAEHREARKHADAMQRHRERVLGELAEIERAQDDLLDRLLAE